MHRSLPLLAADAPAGSFSYSLYHARRIMVSCVGQLMLRGFSEIGGIVDKLRGKTAVTSVVTDSLKNSSVPSADLDKINPFERSGFKNPYLYYRLMRDQHPVYKPAGADFYYVSRYEDVVSLVKQTDACSSTLVAVMMAKRFGREAGENTIGDPMGSLRNWGVNPVDVLATQDPPAHGYQRAASQTLLTPRVIRTLEADVRQAAIRLIEGFLPRGGTEFMEEIAWRLPLTVTLNLLGFPLKDYERIKEATRHGVAILSETCTLAEFTRHGSEIMWLFRYTWSRYLEQRARPTDNLTSALIRAADDPDHPMTHEEAVSIVFLLINAGADSSASTMGNALKMLIEHPAIEQRLRAEPARIPDFIDEVLRLESPFQGHFRITRKTVSVRGVDLPPGTRVFLNWASANRDERFWTTPDAVDIDRENLRRHVAFGYGPHACVGRELARMEIRIVLEELLRRTSQLSIAGATPYVAGVFQRTLVALPIRVQAAAA